jgi:multidrug resistance protein
MSPPHPILIIANPSQVKFRGEDDPEDPKNWPSNKKWAITAVTAAFTFVSPLASSMIAPALPQLAEDFGVRNMIETQMLLSIFVLAYAIGPMFLGPLSELYGRSIILQVSNGVFLAFNLACGFAQTSQQMLAFRFLSGIGGSAPLAIGGGVLGDLFRPEERGKAMGLYSLGPLLGPAVGPIVGSWVAQYSTWRWIFWASSAADFLIMVAGIWKMRECYAPYLLHKKAKALRKQTGNPAYFAQGEGDVNQPIWKKIAKVMGRAFGMLFTQPIVQVMSVYMAFSYGVLYLGLSTLAHLFSAPRPDGYGQSLGISGLHYLSLGLGFFFGAPICGKSSDKMYQYFKSKDPRGQGKPEYRMPIVIPFSFLVPIGLLIYGWSAQYFVHWIVPDIGLFFFGMGTIAAFQCVTTYLVDSYARLAASAVAAVTILRSLAGFTFPLFAPAMFNALGNGWGNTVLALAAIGVGTPVPVLLWMFGEKLRKRSSLAAKPKPPGSTRRGKGPGGPPGDQGVAPSGPQGPPPPFSEGKRRHG